ncbi:MAG: TerB family tellurite resistance protein [Terricaulis sp.]|nr:TerB family tellurite resistance protein [Terricaulis sp.]
MLKDLLKRLSGESAAPLPPEDARLAVAALLVIAANADFHYQDTERAMIERVLADRYGLDAAAAKALREEGEAAEAAAMDLYKFTSLIKQTIEYEQRASVLEAMWRVVLADDVREAHEETLMRRITDLLGLDPRESIAARKRVAG